MSENPSRLGNAVGHPLRKVVTTVGEIERLHDEAYRAGLEAGRRIEKFYQNTEGVTK